MKVLSEPKLDLNKIAAFVTIILLGMVAFTFLRTMIGIFCENLARPLFYGL